MHKITSPQAQPTTALRRDAQPSPRTHPLSPTCTKSTSPCFMYAPPSLFFPHPSHTYPFYAESTAQTRKKKKWPHLRHNSCIVPCCDRSAARTTSPFVSSLDGLSWLAQANKRKDMQAVETETNAQRAPVHSPSPLDVTPAHARPMQGTDGPPTALAWPSV